MSDSVFVTASDGIDVFVALDGPVGSEAVLILHGYLGDGSQWNGSVQPLLDAGYRSVRPDHRGHGDSTNVGEESAYSMEQLESDALGVMDHLGIAKFHLVGHSMGGLVAELIAIHHQERLLSLVLVDCSPIGGKTEKPIWAKVRRFLGYKVGPARLLRLLRPIIFRIPFVYKNKESRDKVTTSLEGLQSSIDKHDPAAFVALGEELSNHSDLRPFLGAIKVATTVVVGENEVASLRLGTEALAEAIPGAQFEVIAGAGHSPPMEQTELFNKALIKHLEWSNTGH